jgi:hypothetical protein
MERLPRSPGDSASAPPVIPALNEEELQDLAYAKYLLENPGFAARLAGAVGRPIEKGIECLPAGWAETVHRATRTSLMKALDVAVSTLGRSRRVGASERWHKLLVGTSGGVGGAFGLAALPFELPISTVLMLRSIADIARSEGHNVGQLEVKLSCLEVFALGGPKREDDAVESSYWAVRATLAKAVSEAIGALAQKELVETSAPTILRLVGVIASRFGVVVSEQMAAKAVPVLGAAGGSIVNLLFLDHFQDMARGHFIIKRLEAVHGVLMVRDLYHQVSVSPNLRRGR